MLAGPRLMRAALGLLALGFVAAAVYFWDGGLIEAEATYFIRGYLDDRSLLQKVFDPHANDLGTYQARELSYFIDYVDARSFQMLLAPAAPFFVPMSALLASFLTVIIFLVGASKVTPRLNPVTAGLVLLLYLSNHIYAVTTAVYYRSTKPLLTPVLLATLFFLIYAVKQPRSPTTKRERFFSGPFVVLFVLGCTMSLLDRQGFFYLIVVVAGLALYQRSRSGPRDLLWGAVAALTVMIVYNVMIGPWIVKSVNGYSPNWEYQKIPVHHLLTHPRHFIQAFKILTQATRLILGSFPDWVYLGIGVSIFVWKVWVDRMNGARVVTTVREIRSTIRRRLREPRVRLIGFVAGSQVLMFALMIIRHPPIWDLQDHRLWYYPLPFQILVVFGLLLLLDKGLCWPRRMSLVAVNAVLITLIIGNIVSWPGYRRVMLDSKWFPEIYHQSVILKESLRQQRPHHGLNRHYQALYDYCVKFPPSGSDQRP